MFRQNMDKQIPEAKLIQSTRAGTTRDETSETTVRNLLSLYFYILSYIKCILFFRRPILNQKRIPDLQRYPP